MWIDRFSGVWTLNWAGIDGWVDACAMGDLEVSMGEAGQQAASSAAWPVKGSTW